MPIFKVVRKEVSHAELFVEAESKELAEEIADQVDDQGWHEYQDYHRTFRSTVAKPTELKNRYIHPERGEVYRYGDKTTA